MISLKNMEIERMEENKEVSKMAGLKIFYDVDTQHDFMDKDGALYVPGAEETKPNLKRLTDYAKKEFIPIWGSKDRHFENDPELKRNGGPFPDHCMDKNYGMELIPETDYDLKDYETRTGFGTETIPHKISKNNETYHPSPGKLELTVACVKPRPREVNGKWKSVGGNVIFEKQHNDVFTNPMASALMLALDIKEAVVYGVATDYCVKAAVLGMQKRGIRCYVVKDAIATVTPETGKSALEEMVEAGAKLITTDDVLANKMSW
jgi:nicotinamidase/pyrazinamidase